MDYEKEPQDGQTEAWLQNLALPLICCVILGESLPLSGPQAPHLPNENVALEPLAYEIPLNSDILLFCES